MEKTYEGFFKRFKKKEVTPKKELTREELKREIESCFVDLSDSGFDVSGVYDGRDSVFLIRISDPNKIFKKDSVEIIKETLLFAKSYLNEFRLDFLGIDLNYGRHLYSDNYSDESVSFIEYSEDNIEQFIQFIDNKYYSGFSGNGKDKINYFLVAFEDINNKLEY